MSAVTAESGSTPRSSSLARWRLLAGTGLAMMLHDKMKLAGALAGVVFATLLATQQAGTFLGLMSKNTMLIDHSGADIWVIPAGAQTLQAGKAIPERDLHRARGVSGVAWASPLLWVGGSVQLPGGGTEQVTVLGVDLASMRGGPWNVVAGDAAMLSQPSAMIFEDSEREKLGGLNLGSVREVNGRRAQAVGFTLGLLPFGPSYAFASYDFARELSGRADRDQSMILVGVEPGRSPDEVVARLRAELPDVEVYTGSELAARTIRYVVSATSMGTTFATSVFFGLLVGFVIVALTMFSGVLDNLREFGTLKAIGATTGDLARILLVQAVVYALVGSALGLTLVGNIARAMKSPQLAMVLPSALIAVTPALMLLICVVASTLGLLRLRKLEPAIVFRG